jgi:hypothetical protein
MVGSDLVQVHPVTGAVVTCLSTPGSTHGEPLSLTLHRGAGSARDIFLTKRNTGRAVFQTTTAMRTPRRHLSFLFNLRFLAPLRMLTLRAHN